MCGIAGLIQTTRDKLNDNLTRMTRSLAHRGPDGEGIWLHPTLHIGLGHRRLSVVDLSEAGHQPMMSASERYVMTYNGEVYNAAEMSKELTALGYRFRGHSDTEVMLAAFEAWGIDRAVDRFVGMFAIGLIDKHENTLTLIRDRVGLKPVYLGWLRNGFGFASELKAFVAHPEFRPIVDRASVALFLKFGYIPSPASVYHHIFKLKPGHRLTLKLDDKLISMKDVTTPEQGDWLERQSTCYWSLKDIAQKGLAEKLHHPESALLNGLEERLTESVRSRLVADVPVGVFLSGGVDSALVTALVQKVGSLPVRTFSIGFRDDSYNEAHHAAAISRHLGTEHTELYLAPGEVMELVDQMPRVFDEPFADSSQIPTYLVSRMARRYVTVCLSGDGGDELMGGYNRYIFAPRVYRMERSIPPVLRSWLGRMLRLPSVKQWNKFGEWMRATFPRQWKFSLLGDKIYKIASTPPLVSDEAFYAHLISCWPDKENPVLQFNAMSGHASPPMAALESPDANFTDRMMFADMMSYLPEDILTKVDRASMAVSLEAREPLLDHRVIEYAWQLPQELKIRGQQGKYGLRQILYRHVPRELIERPKMGFSIPLGDWLRKDLTPWVDKLLHTDKIQSLGLLNPAVVKQTWEEHRLGHHNWESRLWAILMLQLWLSEQSNVTVA